MATLRLQIPTPRTEADFVRVALAIEWTRRPDYAVIAQVAPNKLNNAAVHWLDLYTGPVTWQIRDRAGLISTIDLLTEVHRTATVVFPDGAEHATDPTTHDW